MPRTPVIPSYRLHKHSGQAVVTLPCGFGRRKDVFLGLHGSAQSRAEYARVLSEWLTAGGQAPRSHHLDLTVNEIAVRFLDHAELHYRRPDGSPTGETDHFKLSLRPLRELYGHTRGADFGPLSLKAVREKMVASDLCRNVVNSRIGRLKAVFKWATGEELVPVAVHTALATVVRLSRGRTAARETEPIKPVLAEHVDAVRPHVRPSVWAMIRLQQLTGMRPGEVCQIRQCELDRTQPIWVYRPAAHKTAWRGHERTIALGPRAQEVLEPFLTGRGPDDFLFSPAAEVAAQRAEQKARRAARGLAPLNRKKKARPRRLPGAVYTPDSYLVAVRRGCVRAGVPMWHPNQLRHAAATEVRKQFGLEAAQVLLGHSRADTTQIYAEKNLTEAERVAAARG